MWLDCVVNGEFDVMNIVVFVLLKIYEFVVVVVLDLLF